MLAFIDTLKPVFHGACFGAVSAQTLYAPYPRPVFRALSPLSMERVLERFRRRFGLRVFRSEQALLLKKNASTMNIAHVSMGADCRAD